MLTVFILESSKGKDIQKLKESFANTMASFSHIQPDVKVPGIDCVFNLVQRIGQINSTIKEGDWFMVLYDNEYIDPSLLKSLPTFMSHTEFDVYVIMKRTLGNKGLETTQAPRLFQSTLMLQPDSLLPIREDIQSERILNGWILDADS